MLLNASDEFSLLKDLSDGKEKWDTPHLTRNMNFKRGESEAMVITSRFAEVTNV